MVVTVAVVRMMQMTVNQVTGVVAVRNGFMPAAGAVDVVGRVTTANMVRGAPVRILGRDFDSVVLHVATILLVVQMAVVQIVNVVAVLNGGMTAALTVVVIVMIALVVVSHNESSPVVRMFFRRF